MRRVGVALLAFGIASTASAQSVADKLLADRQYDQALAQLQRDLAFEPDNPHLRSEAAEAACGIGNDAYARGDQATAIAKAEQAIGFDETAGCGHLIRGRVLADRGDSDAAQKELARAEQLMPEVAGIAVLRQRAARDAESAKDSSDHDGTRHFKGELFGEAPAHSLGEVLTSMESARDQVQRAMGATVDAPIVVMVYAGASYATAAQSPEWSAGSYDGKIRVMLGDEDPASDGFRDRLAHEYAHAVVRSLSGGRAPAWLDEGLAMHVQQGAPPGWEADLAAARRAGSFRPLSSLGSSFIGLPQEQVRLAYQESYGAVDRLDRDFGRERIVGYLRKLGGGEDPKAAFDESFARGFDRFTKDFEGGR